jgi:hypothetical protein
MKDIVVNTINFELQEKVRNFRNIRAIVRFSVNVLWVVSFYFKYPRVSILEPINRTTVPQSVNYSN